MSNEEQTTHLTKGRLLAHNTIWNLLGQILPMFVGLVTFPLIIRAMGVDRFGLLSLAWIVVGYFSLFDLGIGRALTKLIADKLGTKQEHSIPRLAWTSLFLMFFLGLFGALVTALFSPLVVHRLLKIPQPLQTETLRSFYLLAASIPMVTTTAGLRGILEALQRFRLATFIRIPMSVFSLVGPLFVFPFSHSLVAVIAILIAGRLVSCAAHFWACIRSMPGLRHGLSFDASLIPPALKLGGWMTVSNIVGPIMSYLDRFLIAALLSVTAVSYYTAPADMISRILVIPTAIAGVLFPAFAVSLVQEPAYAGLLFSRGVKYMFLVIFPIVLVIVTLAPEGLRIWLGAAFADHGAPALRWLAVGTLLNCLAFVPFALLQGAGRPQITGMLNLIELPFYLAVLWLLIKFRGIEGAAMAWAGRVSVDAVLLLGFADNLLPRGSRLFPRVVAGIAAALLVLCPPVFLNGFGVKVLCLSLSLFALGALTWFWLLTPTERALLIRLRPALAVADAPVALSQTSRTDAT